MRRLWRAHVHMLVSTPHSEEESKVGESRSASPLPTPHPLWARFSLDFLDVFPAQVHAEVSIRRGGDICRTDNPDGL